MAGGRSFRKTLDLLRRFDTAPCARTPGMLDAVDARVRLLGFLWVIVAVTLLRHLLLIGVALMAGLILTAVLRTRVERFLPLWAAALAFSLVISAPAALNLVTPGPVLLPIFGPFELGPVSVPRVALTSQGLYVVCRLVLRTAASVTFALALALGSDPRDLVRALGSLGVPRAFVMTFAMMHRYLASLVRAAHEIHTAKLSRTIGPEPRAEHRRWVGSGIGLIFLRAHRLTGQVHRAMVSRGFDGEFRSGREPSLRWTDLAVAIVFAAAGLTVVLLDRALSH